MICTIVYMVYGVLWYDDVCYNSEEWSNKNTLIMYMNLYGISYIVGF